MYLVNHVWRTFMVISFSSSYILYVNTGDTSLHVTYQLVRWASISWNDGAVLRPEVMEAILSAITINEQKIRRSKKRATGDSFGVAEPF